jgi:hypothetical protein
MGTGGLDDALARMARREQLRRRAEGGGELARSPVEDLAETLRHLVARHESLSVAVIAQDAGVTWQVRAARTGGEVRISVARVDAVLNGGAHRPPEPPAGQTAARLADLLRHNPSLLDGPLDE